jgi:CRP/FNR family cyclic AMP-dependent transcriptional regulator
MLADVLALTESLPVRTLAPGERLFSQGDTSSTIVVLIEGELVIETGGVVVNRHTEPGSFIGEIGALLRQPHSATASAARPTILREIGEPHQFFATYPQLGLEVARQLAGRLHRLTAYVADVQRQFAGRDDHLGMLCEMIDRIAMRPPVDIEPGSDRAPDY